MVFFLYGYGDNRDLHVLTHSFPTRRSSDLGDVSTLTSPSPRKRGRTPMPRPARIAACWAASALRMMSGLRPVIRRSHRRSEENTSELQSLLRRPHAVFCLKEKNNEQSKRQLRQPVRGVQQLLRDSHP